MQKAPRSTGRPPLTPSERADRHSFSELKRTVDNFVKDTASRMKGAVVMAWMKGG
jgi:hypothetical protein